jgi:hypothetical protein
VGIPKKATEVYIAALGNGNVSGGGPYDSTGNLRAGAVQYHLKPANGDFSFTPAPPPPVWEIHNGRGTGRPTVGDDTPQSASISLTMRSMDIRNFLLGRHATAVSTVSESETTDSPSEIPFCFWTKRVITLLDGSQEVEIIGHCYCAPQQAQGEQETLTLNIEIHPPEFDTIRDGYIYMI